MNYPIQPDWLHEITYGLAEGRKTRVLIDGVRFAVVQSPGGRWYDNSGGHYGGTTFHLVDKQATNLRKAHGLMDCRQLQHGGRAKTAQWKQLVEDSDTLGHVSTDRCGTCMESHNPDSYYNHNFVQPPKGENR